MTLLRFILIYFFSFRPFFSVNSFANDGGTVKRIKISLWNRNIDRNLIMWVCARNMR